jgi:hypothetical protein
MGAFVPYRRKQIAELRPYEPGEDLAGVSVSAADKKAGSPKAGDMIARNPKNHVDQWLVEAKYFADNFEPLFQAAGEIRWFFLKVFRSLGRGFRRGRVSSI